MVFGLKEAGFVEIWNLTSRASVSGAGSVTSVALGLAHALGCNPIIMAGADFCWDPGEPTHARGSAASVPERLVSQCIRHTAYDGRAVLTTSDFLRSAWVMEGQLKEPKVSHYRVGRAGLLDLPEYRSGEEAGSVDMAPLVEMVAAEKTDWDSVQAEKFRWMLLSMIDAVELLNPKKYPAHQSLSVINVVIEYFLHQENDKEQLMQDAKNYIIGGIRKLL